MPNDYDLVRQKTKDTDPQNRSRIVIEPTPEQAEQQSKARDTEIQQRGGTFHDAIKIDPFSKHYQDKEFEKRKTPVSQI